ncbi:hypothetical protein HYS93_03095 [Candidatus Daviesbacteria bacterium]|nr:hypothetical protein [Candidatus Daviesbacteria bacterium]
MDSSTDKILFFGYGANKARSKIAYIIGRDPGDHVGAIAEGFVLAVQHLNNIPAKPQSLLRTLYGNEFKAYTLKKGQGLVTGIIWEMTQVDLEKIKQWEFVGEWREIIEIEVESSGGKTTKVLTEKNMDQFKVDGVADGLLYSEFDFVKKNIINPNQTEYYTKKQINKIKNWLATQVAK